VAHAHGNRAVELGARDTPLATRRPHEAPGLVIVTLSEAAMVTRSDLHAGLCGVVRLAARDVGGRGVAPEQEQRDGEDG
jgi:hypothetical protein